MCVRENTFARVMNSLTSGCDVCSSVSRTRVRGLAESRRLSSFWSRRRLCERPWAVFVGTILLLLINICSCDWRMLLTENDIGDGE